MHMHFYLLICCRWHTAQAFETRWTSQRADGKDTRESQRKQTHKQKKRTQQKRTSWQVLTGSQFKQTNTSQISTPSCLKPSDFQNPRAQSRKEQTFKLRKRAVWYGKKIVSLDLCAHSSSLITCVSLFVCE